MFLPCQVQQCCATCLHSQWLCANTHVCKVNDHMSVAEDYCCQEERWQPLVFIVPRLGPQVFGAMVEEGFYVQ